MLWNKIMNILKIKKSEMLLLNFVMSNTVNNEKSEIKIS